MFFWVSSRRGDTQKNIHNKQKLTLTEFIMSSLGTSILDGRNFIQKVTTTTTTTITTATNITELKCVVPREKSPSLFNFWFCVSG